MAECLREGAIDFLPAPYDWSELASRLRGRFESVTSRAMGILSRGRAPIQVAVSLEGREGRLLRLLLLAEGLPLSRDALSLALWGDIRPGSRRLDMLASKLRKSLLTADPAVNWQLRGIRNEGYTLSCLPVDNL